MEAVGAERTYTTEPRSGFMIMGSGECSIGPAGTVEILLGPFSHFLSCFHILCIVHCIFSKDKMPHQT